MPTLLAFNDLLYSLPLIVSISLVYAASRHEAMPEILAHAGRVGGWIVCFMVVVFGLLFWISKSL